MLQQPSFAGGFSNARFELPALLSRQCSGERLQTFRRQAYALCAFEHFATTLVASLQALAERLLKFADRVQSFPIGRRQQTQLSPQPQLSTTLGLLKRKPVSSALV